MVLASGRHTTHQRPPFHIKVDEREADLQPIEVFGDAAVADFAKPEDALENPEGVSTKARTRDLDLPPKSGGTF